MKNLLDVVKYWFKSPIDYNKWFKLGTKLDLYLSLEYKDLVEDIKLNKLKCLNILEILGLIVLLEVFSKYIYRDSVKQFEGESISIELCLKILESGEIDKLKGYELFFVLLPLQHSENIKDKQLILDYINNIIDTVSDDDLIINQNIIEYTIYNRDILKKFGRNPNRNIILGRKSTQRELEYLNNQQNKN